MCWFDWFDLIWFDLIWNEFKYSKSNIDLKWCELTWFKFGMIGYNNLLIIPYLIYKYIHVSKFCLPDHLITNCKWHKLHLSASSPCENLLNILIYHPVFRIFIWYKLWLMFLRIVVSHTHPYLFVATSSRMRKEKTKIKKNRKKRKKRCTIFWKWNDQSDIIVTQQMRPHHFR